MLLTLNHATQLTGGTQPHGAGFADVNGDGKTDLIDANTHSNDVSVFLGNGLDGFGTPTAFGAGLLTAAAIMNTDGRVMQSVTNTITVRNSHNDAGWLIGTITKGSSAATAQLAFSPPEKRWRRPRPPAAEPASST